MSQISLMERRRLNLEEIGQLAGVSRSTVSRVVNGEAHVSAQVRERVEEVIAKTGYRPNAAARSLASNSSGVVGLVIGSAVETLFDDPYFGRLILGLSRATDRLGMTLSLFMFGAERDDQALWSRVIGPGLVDGVVITATTVGDPLVDQLASAEIPFVVVGRPDNPAVEHWVDADNVDGGALAARHLLEHGRRRLAMIAPPANASASEDRHSGFLAELAAHGMAGDVQVVRGDWTESSGVAAAGELDHDIDGVFVGSDRMAVGVLQGLRERGVRCPQDVSVVSFDGLISAERTSPNLTSIVQPVAEVGERAGEVLHQLVRGEPISEKAVKFPVSLRRSESCGCHLEDSSGEHIAAPAGAHPVA